MTKGTHPVAGAPLKDAPEQHRRVTGFVLQPIAEQHRPVPVFRIAEPLPVQGSPPCIEYCIVAEALGPRQSRLAILDGQWTRRLQNMSTKLNPTQVLALRKIATMKSIPYQTLIRQRLAEGIRKELRLGQP